MADEDDHLTLMFMLISLAFALRHKHKHRFVLLVLMLMLMSWVFSLAYGSVCADAYACAYALVKTSLKRVYSMGSQTNRPRLVCSIVDSCIVLLWLNKI